LAWYQPLSTTNNTVTKGTKLSENRTVIRKLSFALRPHRLIFAYCGAIFALPGAFSLVTAVRFSNGQEVLSLTTAAQNMHVFLRKSPLQKSLFRVVENGEFLNRLRKGHLKKSAVTGV